LAGGKVERGEEERVGERWKWELANDYFYGKEFIFRKGKERKGRRGDGRLGVGCAMFSIGVVFKVHVQGRDVSRISTFNNLLFIYFFLFERLLLL